MAVLLPNLDDRRWTDLVEESRSLIPVFAPEWTDHNASDPGITLLELFAFITESLLYRANRITDRQRRRMLALVGVRQRGPSAARVLLSFASDTPHEAPEGTVCSGENATGERVMFRTLAPVSIAEGEVSFVEEPDGAVTVTLSQPVPAGARLSLGFIVRGDGTSFAERDRIAADDSPPEHHSVRLIWECSGAHWEAAEDVDDRTRSLTLDGIVALTTPVETNTVRARVTSGEYDVTREILVVFLNAAEAEQAVYSSPELLPVATGDGSPFQRIGLAGAPVIEESVVIETDDGPWELRDDLAGSLPSSRHFVLDARRGEVKFGDGQDGQAPAQGVEIRARYLRTAAAAGQVAAGAIDRIEDAGFENVRVSNPEASEGGADAETLEAAIGRARLLREAPLRAVTADDLEAIALDTPGAGIARASARPNLYPGLACVKALGVMTVIVVPDSEAPRPMPSAGLLAYVARRLERRRIIGTRIVVTGPDYVEVAVYSRVILLRGADREAVRLRVVETLTSFFDPLGWPFGRDVYRSEVLQAIDGVEGVDFVEKLELAANRCEPSCGNICLAATALVAEGRHRIEVIA
jgi:predicted phage baseplate assembly protein